MAKITTLKFDINGTNYAVHINCTSSGQFTANIPEVVSVALNLQSKVTANTLIEVENKINNAVKSYKESETKQEVFILIKYQANGYYMNRANEELGTLFGQHTPFYLEGGFSRSDAPDAIGFEFKLCIKETVDNAVNWFEARKGYKVGDSIFADKDNPENPDLYYKEGKCYNEKDWKKIPFSEVALQTLTVAREKLRNASEMLFNFIKQSEEDILLTLTSQKLLN